MSREASNPQIPNVAVLINNYNNGPWIEACVASVLTQTRPADSIVLYDDGSTDDSLARLDQFSSQIQIISGRHDDQRSGFASQAHAVARAFQACPAADHYYLLDGDDAFEPTKIATYEDAWAQAPDAVLVQAPTRLVDHLSAPLRDGYEHLKHPSDGDYLAATYRTQDSDLYYSTSALAFSRQFLAATLPLDYGDGIPLAVDSRLSSVAPLFGPVIGLHESLTLWRQHERSQSVTTDLRRPLLGTLRRNKVFNTAAKRLQRRRIHLGLNPRFYRQLARHLAPAWLSAPFARNPAGERPTGA